MALQPYTKTTHYPGGNPYYKGPRAVGGGGGGMNAATLQAIQRAKAYYQPGGGFGKGVEAGLERGRKKSMASGMQHLVGAGLAGTTMAGTLGKKYEEEVAAPARMGVESQRAQALSGIEMSQAGMGFQAGQSADQRSLQMYLADLQTGLQSREMMQRGRTAGPTAAPAPQARQFPSVYGQTGTGGPRAPDLGYGDVDWAPPREYQPSMVGKSSWAQRGSMWS